MNFNFRSTPSSSNFTVTALFDDGEKDTISEYESKYGNYNIIDWYEGLKSTESFLEEFMLSKGDDSIEKI